jgi:hypothetical protein
MSASTDPPASHANSAPTPADDLLRIEDEKRARTWQAKDREERRRRIDAIFVRLFGPPAGLRELVTDLPGVWTPEAWAGRFLKAAAALREEGVTGVPEGMKAHPRFGVGDFGLGHRACYFFFELAFGEERERLTAEVAKIQRDQGTRAIWQPALGDVCNWIAEAVAPRTDAQSDFADAAESTSPPATATDGTQAPQGSTLPDSEEHPLLRQRRAEAQQKAEQVKLAEKRRQELEPLRAAWQQVDDILLSVQGPVKPSEANCQTAAVALYDGLKAVRAALAAASKMEAIEAIRRDVTDPEETDWLSDTVRNERPIKEISDALLLLDRSHLRMAWSNIGQTLMYWRPRVAVDPATARASKASMMTTPTAPLAVADKDNRLLPSAASSPTREKACSFRWLHLTDLHFGQPGQKWLWPNMRDEFFRDLERLHEIAGPWEIVLFTGDFVQRGRAEEFAQLNDLLDRLWEKLASLGSTPVLLCVPGNHDLLRPKPERAAVTGLRAAANSDWSDRLVREHFWSNPTSEYRRVVEKAFKNYLKWWGEHKRRPHSCQPGKLPGDFSVTLAKEGRRLGVVGLNTTFLQLDGGDYERKLAVSPQQFHEACGGDGAAWVLGHDACLVLTHQPPSWLLPGSLKDFNGEIAVPGRFAAHLFGHLHMPSARSISAGGAKPRREWQACSLFGLEEWGEEGGKNTRLHGYSAGLIQLEGATGFVRQWPRRAEPQQAGHLRLAPDHSFELGADDGTPAESFSINILEQRL